MVALSKSRIEALSGGAFGIAMTLLASKLEAPEHQHSNDEMLAQILALRPLFLTYMAMFMLAGGSGMGMRGVGESALHSRLL